MTGCKVYTHYSQIHPEVVPALFVEKERLDTHAKKTEDMGECFPIQIEKVGPVI